jgi:hypothetical protein
MGFSNVCFQVDWPDIQGDWPSSQGPVMDGSSSLRILQLQYGIPPLGTGCRSQIGDHFQQQIPDPHL